MHILNREQTKHIVILPTYQDPNLDARELDRIHRNQGCAMIRYHYLIRLDGMVETGRELDKRGNHRRSYNKNSVYVALSGVKDNFNSEMFKELEEIVAELQDLYPHADTIDLT